MIYCLSIKQVKRVSHVCLFLLFVVFCSSLFQAASGKSSTFLSESLLETNGKVIDKIITGTVHSSSGAPVEGAIVQVQGGNSTQTDANGRFQISVEEGETVEITHPNFFSEQFVVDEKNDYQVYLIDSGDISNVEEVVLTGYTGYRKEQTPNAVSTVDAEQINNVSAGSFDQVLQGKVPGMRVTSSSGQPGSAASVIIRGMGSINGTQQPLYIIDNVPVEANRLETMNPNDVESVTVLKDASAKALYGSRGSNGVVIIKTKSGKKGRLAISYSSQTGISQPGKQNFEMMNTEEILRFQEEVGLEIGRDIGPGWTYSPRNPRYTNQSPEEQLRRDNILDSLRGINNDWREMFLQTGRYFDQNLSLSGGSDQIEYFGSVNYHEQEGILKNTGLRRISLRNNVKYTQGNFTAMVNTSIGFSRSEFTSNEGGTSVGSPLASMYYALPYENPYGPDGKLYPASRGNMVFLDTREGARGIDVMENSRAKENQFKTIIGVDLRYKISPDLEAMTRVGVDYRTITSQNYINPDSYIGSINTAATLGGSGAFGEGYSQYFNIISTSGLTYSKTFGDKHDIEISGFAEFNRENYRSFNYTGFGVDGRLPETPAGITVNTEFLPNIGGGRTSSSLQSYMAVARYTFDRKYTITGSYRRDGSTKVIKYNRWHGFYSFGANWNMKRENFLANSQLIKVLSLRASYGQTASQFSGDFLYLPTYSTNTYYGNNIGMRPASPGNPNFNWEFVNEFNVGFDLGLFQGNRLNVSADFYSKITQNMFIDQPLSGTSGFISSIPLSTGEMSNRGVEVSIDGMLIKTPDFQWSLGANGAYNKNEITRVTENVDEFLDGDTRIIKKGLPYGTYYAPRWAGVNPQTGEAQYYTVDGQITTNYDFDNLSVPLDKTFLPKFTGGFNTTIVWKNLSFYTLFTFVADVHRWNNQDFYIENEQYMTSNQSKEMLYNRWKEPGDIAKLQRIDIPRNFTSKDIQDASYLRWRNVRLSYNFGDNALKQLNFIKNFTIYVEGTNLYTWTKFRGLDPETNLQYGRFGYPSARTFTLGLNIDF